jgi:ATP-binding protein involved in chromosome partitioning
MTNEQDKLVDLLRINYETDTKCNFHCEDCHRFFDCSFHKGQNLYTDTRIEQIRKNLINVTHIIAVLSGKGGVGKSIISANLAVALAKRGYSTAILDSDLHGPSIPSILGVNGSRLKFGKKGIIPVEGPLGVKIVSIRFLFDDDNPVTWLSDRKREAQQLFLANIDYGNLDYLIIDTPPGTGSETVNLFKCLRQLLRVLMVTAPSDITGEVVQRCISLCQKARVPIIGLIENMSGVTCPNCGREYALPYSSTNMISKERGIPILGKISRDPLVVEAADRGSPFVLEYPSSKAANDMHFIVDKIETAMGSKRQETAAKTPEGEGDYKPLDIIEINASHPCYGQSCYQCATYFQCTSSRKSDFFIKPDSQIIKGSMGGIKHKVAVMSCKGGVGKSTFAANLAVALSLQGKATTILDCDFHGPCIPKILGVERQKLKLDSKGIKPTKSRYNTGVISVDFLIEADEAVTWFDSLKKMTMHQLLFNVSYGDLDYLIIDLPPGTGAESYALLQSTPDLDGVVIITLPSQNPQEVASRSVALCRQAGVPVIGIIENMSDFTCPGCNQVSRTCGAKGVRTLARKMHIPFLGELPFDQSILASCDEGMPFVAKYPDSAGALSLLKILHKIQKTLES